MAARFVDLKCELGAVENERRVLPRTYLGREQCDGLGRDTFGVPNQVSIGDVLPAAGALIAERIRMGASLHLGIADSCCRNRTTTLVEDLFDEGAFRIRKEFMIAYRDGIGFGNPHAGIPAKDFVSAEEQIEFLFQRDGKRIDFDRGCVLSGAPNGTPQIHGRARNPGAGHRNLNREGRYTLDFGLCDKRAGRESPGIADENANAESLAVLITDTINISIFHTN